MDSAGPSLGVSPPLLLFLVVKMAERDLRPVTFAAKVAKDRSIYLDGQDSPQPAPLMYLKMELRLLRKTPGHQLVEVVGNGRSQKRIRVAWRILKLTMRESMFT